MIKKVKTSFQEEELDRRIYNILLLVAILAGPLVIIGNIVQGLHIIAIISPVVVTAVFIFIYYLSVEKNLMFKFLVCLVFLAFTAVQWIYNGGGSSGGMQYFFIWTFVIATILLRGVKLTLYILINCTILLLLLSYEYLDGSLIVQYADDTSRFIDIIISASLTFILVSFMVKILFSVIDKERQKYEKLLLNILPRKVIKELKDKGNTSPEIFKEVTVLFSDIVGFTDLSSKLPVETLITELNDIFTAYDNIVEKHFCERIKTIGDAYMAVCGLPDSNEKHCGNIVNAAIEMMQYMESRNKVNPIKLQIRIGIHTGHVIGSVVGIKKYIYDVFGDTVNTAARLEGLSMPMRINISHDVKENLSDSYNFEDRGLIDVKGKQAMQMFFINAVS